MARSYYPGAVLIAQRCHRYLTRYQAKLTPPVTPEQNAALTSLIASLAAFLVLWPKEPLLP